MAIKSEDAPRTLNDAVKNLARAATEVIVLAQAADGHGTTTHRAHARLVALEVLAGDCLVGLKNAA